MKRRSRRREAPAAEHRPIDDLPFVKRISPAKHPKGYGRCCWAPARSGDYAADLAIGAAYADELVAWLRKHPIERNMALRLIVGDMILGGQHDGVAVGFLRKVNWYFVRGIGAPLPREGYEVEAAA